MKKYQYILLDWDGNLAQTLHVWLNACRTVLERHGVSVTDREIGASFGSIEEWMTKWGMPNAEVAMAEADAIAKRDLPNVELYPDALVVLKKLHDSGKKLALITTSPHENVAHLLEKHDIRDFFSAIIAGDDVTHHKPHPEPLEKGLQALGGTKELAVMIGDSDKDIGAANNFGVDSILFYPPEHATFYDIDELRALQPTHVVADFKEVLRTI